MPEQELDLDGKYMINNWEGIAWRLLGYVEVLDEDYEWSGITNVDESHVNAVMIGDDRVFTFEVGDLILIDEEDFCPECGQIGCQAGRL